MDDTKPPDHEQQIRHFRAMNAANVTNVWFAARNLLDRSMSAATVQSPSFFRCGIAETVTSVLGADDVI
jgi:hypothetical protein